MDPINPISPRFQTPIELQPKADDQASPLLDKADKMVKDLPFIRSILTLIRQSLSLANNVDSSLKLDDTIAWFYPINSFFTIIGGFNNFVTVIKKIDNSDVKPDEKLENQLETAQAAIRVVNAGTSLASTLDTFDVFKLADVTNGMGRIPVIGSFLATTFPFSTVTSLFSIAGNQIEIFLSSIAITKTVYKVKRATDKIQKLWNQPISALHADYKIKRVVTKQATLVKQAERLHQEIKNKEPKLQELTENYEANKQKLNEIVTELKSRNKIAQVFGSIVPKWRLWQAKRSLENELKSYDQLHTGYSAAAAIHAKLGEKSDKWQKIHHKLTQGTATDQDIESLETMRREKVEKWKTKKVELLFTIVKEATGIALSLVGIAVTIVGIALALIYTGGAPIAALITMAAIAVTLSVVRISRNIYLDWIRETPNINSINTPSLLIN